ncbi:MAG TPA: DUF4255 domain-containing protein [Chitinophagaceae bacterium]|nr:DUF4255 domain-containing protein [Chitinophagaceae bacterium]
MIYQAINLIKNQLRTVIPATEIGSISESTNGTGSSSTDPDILISLINIEENRISRDPKNYVQSGSQILLKNPAVHLNLTLLFTAIKSATAYEPALENLQKVILFFQGKYVFDHINTPDLDPGIEKLILEMVSMNTEQLNHIWSILGGKYHPSVVYRVRMITIDSVSPQGGMIIKEIEANYHEK